ncbi:Hypothetical predicted protein, partial [Marmota monax]
VLGDGLTLGSGLACPNHGKLDEDHKKEARHSRVYQLLTLGGMSPPSTSSNQWRGDTKNRVFNALE